MANITLLPGQEEEEFLRYKLIIMKRLFYILAVMCTMCSLAWSNEGWTVRGGDGVGPLKLGMKVEACEKIVKRNPNADQAFVAGKRPFWIFYLEGVQINYDNTSKVLQIYVDKTGIPTDKGVQVGDPQDKFMNAYGRGFVSHELPTAKGQPKQSVYVYKSSGLGFQVEGGIVKFIIVTPKIH
ncbi:hypothetical protein IJT10_05765 [bacterium]|nr:hypothetical protein [bacterium]